MNFIRRTETKGGTAVSSGTNNFIPDAKDKDTGDEAFVNGLEVGRASPEGVPNTETWERTARGYAERNNAALSGASEENFQKAMAFIRRTPGDFNGNAILAKTGNELIALLRATKEQSKPAIIEFNNAQAELLLFESRHKRGPLPDNSYNLDPSLKPPVIRSALGVLADTFFNGASYIQVMEGGGWQAFVLSVAQAGAMGIFGAFAGRALSYWSFKTSSVRKVWRAVLLGTTTFAVIVAASGAQYRVFVGQVANGLVDAEASMFSVPFGVSGGPVFIFGLGTFVFSALKFIGGPGTPWAKYGDHAEYDRAAKLAANKVHQARRSLLRHIQEISADALDHCGEVEKSDSEWLKTVTETCDTAKLDIRDKLRSDQAYFNLIQRDISLFRDGVRQIRRDLRPEDFAPLPTYCADGFPDAAELDVALAQATAVIATRAGQLDTLRNELSDLARKTLEDFDVITKKIARSAEEEREENAKLKPRNGASDGEPA